jgi:hypothetical protein
MVKNNVHMPVPVPTPSEALPFVNPYSDPVPRI